MVRWKSFPSKRILVSGCREVLTRSCPHNRSLAAIMLPPYQYFPNIWRPIKLDTSLLDTLKVPYEIITYQYNKQPATTISVSMDTYRIDASWRLLVARMAIQDSYDQVKRVSPFVEISFEIQDTLLFSFLGQEIAKEIGFHSNRPYNGPYNFYKGLYYDSGQGWRMDMLSLELREAIIQARSNRSKLPMIGNRYNA
jgi:hypothetical protein